jgi:hypothetical protein
MPTMFSGILLIFIVSGSPLHIRVVDKFSSMDNCQKVIEAVERGEASAPVDERVSNRLKCLTLSYPKDDDNDGPKPPVAPMKVVPQYGEPRPCRHPIYHSEVRCKEAGLVGTQ